MLSAGHCGARTGPVSSRLPKNWASGPQRCNGSLRKVWHRLFIAIFPAVLVLSRLGPFLRRHGFRADRPIKLHSSVPPSRRGVRGPGRRYALRSSFPEPTNRHGTRHLAGALVARDLLGLPRIPEKPAPNYRRLSRYDETGLIWLLRGRPVVALSDATAAIERTRGAITIYRKNNKPAQPGPRSHRAMSNRDVPARSRQKHWRGSNPAATTSSKNHPCLRQLEL
jgi:hypothetical protein